MRRIAVAFVLALGFCGLPAVADPGLTANGVLSLNPSDVRASLGQVIFPSERLIAGEAHLEQGNSEPPTLSMLGCRFEVQLQSDNLILNRAAPILSRKLTSGGDPPPAGFGQLVHPQPIGVTDPLSVVACDKALTYFVFFFRRTPNTGVMIVEAVVLEYDSSGRQTFERETFDEERGRHSLQMRDVVGAARGAYRLSFRAPADAVRAVEEEAKQGKDLLSLLLLIAPVL